MIAVDATAMPCTNCLDPTSRIDHGIKDAEVVDFAEIQSSFDDINVIVLVNNVGGNRLNPLHLSMRDTSEARITENVNLDALFPFHLKRARVLNLI